MAYPSFTYTLTNGTTADASQVMQNFNDILNGVSDGTKDLSIAALTAAGTATFNGNVTLGNATSDDITVTGSLASSIPIKTDATYDIGTTTLGLRKAYFGANSFRVSVGAHAAASATWAMTLPATAGTSGYVMKTDGAGVTSWARLAGTTTNDSAAAGDVGEYVEDVGATVSGITAAVDRNVHTCSFQPGDWDVWGMARFDHSGLDITTAKKNTLSISTTSSSAGIRQTNYMAGNNLSFLTTGISRVSLAATSTVYLVSEVVNVSGTAGINRALTPTIYARRAR